MNFFGHAVVASRERDEPGFVFGSMLPDLVAMSGSRLESIGHPDVADGVEFHHRTDAVFHAAPTFRHHLVRATKELQRVGVHRGGAMGAAHVGLELLLDVALADDARGRHAYAAALEPAAQLSLRWRNDDSGRWPTLLAKLASRGAPARCVAPHQLAARVAFALSRRPRLALNPDDQRLVGEWLAAIHDDIRAATPQLMSEVHDGLRQP